MGQTRELPGGLLLRCRGFCNKRLLQTGGGGLVSTSVVLRTQSMFDLGFLFDIDGFRT